MTLHGALLEEYARTVGGDRSYRGNIDARIECNGLGGDIRTLQGRARPTSTTATWASSRSS